MFVSLPFLIIARGDVLFVRLVRFETILGDVLGFPGKNIDASAGFGLNGDILRLHLIIAKFNFWAIAWLAGVIA